MRGGSESYLIKDSAFYQSKMAAALGVDTIAVYEELRAHVWRSRSRGNGKMRAEVRKGHLSVGIRRQTLADSTGLSVKTVQRRVNLLREIGWVRSENGQPLGGALVYELGHVIQGGMEVFYADMDCREFCLYLEELADQTEDQVYSIPVLERVRLAREWVTRKDRGLYQANGGRSESPTPSVTESHLPPEGGSESPSVIDNPSGERIDKPKKCPGGCAPDTQTGPGPKHWNQPAGQERSKRSQEKMKEEQMAPSLLLTKGGDSGHDDGNRFEGAVDAEKRGKAKADSEKVKEAKRLIVERRSEKLSKKTADESRVKNLEGRQYPPAVVKEARLAWDVYKAEIEAWDDAFVVPQWSAKGSTKTRGQVLELVSMYGGEATGQALRYVVRNWKTLGERMFKNSPGGVPNLGRLFAMHEQLFREATIWGRHRGVLEEWEGWFQENPMKPAPADLKERYEGAQQGLSALGLG